MKEEDIDYRAGSIALDKGDYRMAIAYFQRVLERVAANSRHGGEVQILLVTALQGNGQMSEAIELCQQLSRHPHPDIRQSSRRILYIIQAPELKRPQAWMSEIPDLTTLDDDDYPQKSIARTPLKSRTKTPSPLEKYEQSIDLSQVNTQDNGFIWVATIGIAIVLGLLVINS
jgi:tetratricopeptide (TPR) repeat protein